MSDLSLGTDVLYQARSGMGRAVVICRTRELAYHIRHELDRFVKYFRNVKTGMAYGGVPW